MNSIFPYIIESGLCLLVFFLVYHTLFKHETFYTLNRAYLLSALAFSIVIPIINIRIASEEASNLIPVMLDPVTITAFGGGFTNASDPLIMPVIAGIYFLVMAFLAGRLILNFSRIKRLYKLGSKKAKRDYRLVMHNQNHPPFSFFRTIYINLEHLGEDSLDDIIEHEKAHVRQLHSVDILLTEIMIILQWFNPLVWAHKKSITENHEFLADEAVLNRGFNPDAYQVRIISQLFGIRSMPAAHNFNNSIIKKRLKMIKKPKSPTMAKMKFLLVLPAALAMFYMFACSSGDSEMMAQNAPESESLVYLTPDVMAEYPGGTIAFRKYIAQHVRYPEEAKNKGVQGKVFIQFVVDEEGKIIQMVQNSDVPPPPPAENKLKTVDEPPTPPAPATIDIEGIVVVGYRPPEGTETDYAKEDIQLLADEAIRVLKSVPEKWKPAIKDGKPVKTAWTIPIAFALQ